MFISLLDEKINLAVYWFWTGIHLKWATLVETCLTKLKKIHNVPQEHRVIISQDDISMIKSLYSVLTYAHEATTGFCSCVPRI